MDIKTLLLDLDGTLVDTAPDLGGALNALRIENNLQSLPLAEIRPWASRGARGLLEFGFSIDDDHAEFGARRERLLELYEANLSTHSQLFDGIADLLAYFERDGRRWGIVTNKPDRYTRPLVDALGLTANACCVVSGDTTEHPKPHPASILHALDIAAIEPSSCVYVGDAVRDIEAGRAAGLRTAAARWGYIEIEPPIESWTADIIADSPSHLLELIRVD